MGVTAGCRAFPHFAHPLARNAAPARNRPGQIVSDEILSGVAARLVRDPLQHLSRPRPRLVAWARLSVSVVLSAPKGFLAVVSLLLAAIGSRQRASHSQRRHHFPGLCYIQPNARRILAWGVKNMSEQQSSYMTSLVKFDEDCCTHPFDTVVIERQLRHLNSDEANLEGYFKGKGKRVLLLTSGSKLGSHGLQLPGPILNRFQTWEAAFHQRSATGIMNKSQKTRFNKKKAKQMADFFLQTNNQIQAAPIQAAYDSAAKRDDMADALLQALAYSNVVLGLRPLPQQAELIIID